MTSPGEPAQPVAGVVRVHGIEFEANHGVYPSERLHKRRFRVDVELAAPRALAAAAASDRVEDAIDYETVCKIVVRVGTSRTYHLIEAVCGAMLEALGDSFPGAAITCEVQKLAPPCEGQPEHAAVRMSRPARRA